jgi:transcriptional regulator with XRE-family HTH domain
MGKPWSRLIALRTTKGLSQYELAKLLHMSRSTLANYEQGVREPDHATTSKLANFFGVSVDYLLYRPEVTDTNDPAALPPEWLDVVARARGKGYSPDQVLQALRIMESLRKELEEK